MEVVLLAGLAALTVQPVLALAQAAAPAAAPAAASAAAPATSAAKKPNTQELQLNTRDGVALGATYFPSNKGKEAVPVILIPALKGSQADYKDVAHYLQRKGHAVLAVDLRGQGTSKNVQGGGVLNLDTMSGDQYRSMIGIDMERVKAFLMERNNAGELNIEMLCVVGAEMGAIVAMEWARMDWSWPMLATGKQGQDVKALVLISPVASMKHLKLTQVLSFQPVMRNLSVLILVGRKDSKSYLEANRLHRAFKRYHPDVPEAQRRDRQDLFLLSLDTSLQAGKLLSSKDVKAAEILDEFITCRLSKRAKEFPWKDRK